MGESIINNFKNDLDYSMEDEIFETFYREKFSNIKEIRFEENLNKQLKGIDKTIIFNSGYEITIDEKKRRVDYNDILIELVSNKGTKRQGWLFTTQCDYIAYAIMPKKTIYLIPTTLLKLAWVENQIKWESNYKRIEAKNKDNNGREFITISIPIPIKVLLEGLQKQMVYIVSLEKEIPKTYWEEQLELLKVKLPWED